MRKTFTERKRKLLRRIYGALSLTTAMFIFQACYGTLKDLGLDTFIQGNVKSKQTNQPINGIKISVENQPQLVYSGVNGDFKLFTTSASKYLVRFQDVDGELNGGSFITRDTLVTQSGESYHLDVLLNK